MTENKVKEMINKFNELKSNLEEVPSLKQLQADIKVLNGKEVMVDKLPAKEYITFLRKDYNKHLGKYMKDGEK